MAKKKVYKIVCETCGNEFESESRAWYNCPSCVKRYLKGERHIKKKSKVQKKLEV